MSSWDESPIGLYKTECVKIDGPFRTVDERELATLQSHRACRARACPLFSHRFSQHVRFGHERVTC